MLLGGLGVESLLWVNMVLLIPSFWFTELKTLAPGFSDCELLSGGGVEPNKPVPALDWVLNKLLVVFSGCGVALNSGFCPFCCPNPANVELGAALGVSSVCGPGEGLLPLDCDCEVACPKENGVLAGLSPFCCALCPKLNDGACVDGVGSCDWPKPNDGACVDCVDCCD